MRAKKKVIKLNGVAWPFCLLECNRVADRMNKGEELEVIVEDPDVMRDIVKIFSQSAEYEITWQEEGDCFRIIILRL